MSFKLKNITEATRLAINGLLRDGSVISLGAGDSKDLEVKELVPTYKSVLEVFKGKISFVEVPAGTTAVEDKAKAEKDKKAADELAAKQAQEAETARLAKIAADQLLADEQKAAAIAAQEAIDAENERLANLAKEQKAAQDAIEEAELAELIKKEEDAKSQSQESTPEEKSVDLQPETDAKGKK